MDGEQLRQTMQNVIRSQPARYYDGETAPAELVDNSYHTEFSSVFRAILDEVVGPDMARMFRPKTNT
jgi:hypothetical protein